jgi:hypothetical protein
VARDGADVFFDRENLARRIPVPLAAANVEHEVRENGAAARRVRNLRMKLHTIQPTRHRSHGSHPAGIGSSENLESGGRLGHHIAMAHPDLLAAFDPPQNGIWAGYVELSEAILAAFSLLDHAT